MNKLIHDFQVIILTGGNARKLKPLTDNTPKTLLTIANRKLLTYQLEFIARMGFKEVMVVASNVYDQKILQFIQLFKEENPNHIITTELQVNIEVVEDYVSSAGSLLKVKDKITRDVIVITGDIIVEDDGFLHHMADKHRARDAAVTVLGYYEKKEEGEEKKKKEVPASVDYIGVDQKTDRLLMLVSSTDLEGEFLKVKKSLLTKFPNFTLHTKVKDAHLYIFSRWTFEILEQHKDTIQSIKSHFVPFLARCQYRPKLVEGINIPDFLTNKSKDVFTVCQMSASPHEKDDKVKCLLYILSEETYCTRAVDIPSFMAANREISSGNRWYKPFEPETKGAKHKNFIGLTAIINQKTQIPAGSIVGEYTKIGATVGVKKSMIGCHSNIADCSKILNSVILDHVTIEENAKIQNSIVGDNCCIEENAEITDCIIGSGNKIAAHSVLKGEKISAASSI
jgi:translation initiation factor eIF-2B subunit gamma